MALGGTFLTQSRYWAWHALFCAAPSFIFAVAAGFDTWGSVAAMLAGIATFVALYAFTTSRAFFRRWIDGTMFGEAVYRGALFRSIFAAVGLAASFAGASIPGLNRIPPLLPDMWCGFISVMAVENAVKWFDADFRLIGSHAHSGLVYATTLMQGVMLSLTLFFFVGATWAVLFLLQHLRARNQK